MRQDTTSANRYTIRPCRTLQELEACVALQKRIWGYRDRDLYPLRLFVNLEKIGGHVLAAFAPGDEAVGFVASMPAWRDSERYYHSLSLGVLAAHENRGLGRALKLKQRELAIAAGIRRIEWTFDPMRAKNAFFNIVRLGGIVRRLLPDHYGHVESRLQQGLPSDRLLCEWWLKSPRVRRALSGKLPNSARHQAQAEVVIPSDFARLAEEDPGQARRLQRRVRRQLERHFARGLAITGFIRGEEASRYVLTTL